MFKISKNALLNFFMPATPPKTKAVFDLGSGKFKLLVADIQGKNIQVKFSKLLPVELGTALAESTDKCLSNSAQKTALQALKELKKQAEKYGASTFEGVATEVFRKAKNGEAFLQTLTQETGINLKIISQEKEGILGFCTAVALFPALDEQKIVSWDSGNASFQIVAKNSLGYEVYEGPFGSSIVAKAFIEEIRKEVYTKNSKINPITSEECDQLIKIIQDKISAPNWLKNKLWNSETSVVTLGDAGSIFAVAAKCIGSSCYTKDEVKTAMEKMIGGSTQDFTPYLPSSNPETLLTRIILLYAVMDKFNIHKILFKETPGNTLGLLSPQ